MDRSAQPVSSYKKTSIMPEVPISFWSAGKIKGQIILEALWLAAFCCAFLTILSYLSEKGEQEIKRSRQRWEAAYFAPDLPFQLSYSPRLKKGSDD